MDKLPDELVNKIHGYASVPRTVIQRVYEMGIRSSTGSRRYRMVKKRLQSRYWVIGFYTDRSVRTTYWEITRLHNLIKIKYTFKDN